MIIKGEQKGQSGSLIGIDSHDGIVKMDNLEIKILRMSYLAKMKGDE